VSPTLKSHRKVLHPQHVVVGQFVPYIVVSEGFVHYVSIEHPPRSCKVARSNLENGRRRIWTPRPNFPPLNLRFHPNPDLPMTSMNNRSTDPQTYPTSAEPRPFGPLLSITQVLGLIRIPDLFHQETRIHSFGWDIKTYRQVEEVGC